MVLFTSGGSFPVLASEHVIEQVMARLCEDGKETDARTFREKVAIPAAPLPTEAPPTVTQTEAAPSGPKLILAGEEG